MNKICSFSSVLGSTIERYISLKKALGRQYVSECRILKHLDLFLHNSQSDLTAESYNDWCHTQMHKSPGVLRNNCMRVVRNLCLYRRRTDPKCFVPDLTQFPIPHQAIQPHIFTEAEISRLLNATKKLISTSNSPMRKEIFKLVLVLLYTAGLRRGELCRLKIGDYDPTEHTLLIRESKFHRSRLIPLSYDAWKELEVYLKQRRKNRLPTSKDFSVLWNPYCGEKNKPYGFCSGNYVYTNLKRLFVQAGIYTENGNLPRVHDFRHSFAVHALLRWYREGVDVQAKLPLLSIYMGHVSVVSTEYYLRFIEDVIEEASTRFEKCYSTLITDLKK